MFDLDSPESFDEVFFSSFDEAQIKNELINYINLILLSQNKIRYLSKNNLNYKRISLIKSILPNSLFLIPIRDPLHHSLSLYNQNINFCNLQKKNDFIRRYMSYLGHNEFGLDHKYWHMPIKYKNEMDINYWLEQWIIFYNKIYESYSSDKNCKFVIYEKLPEKNTNLELASFLNINFPKFNEFKCKNYESINLDYNKEMIEVSKKIYLKFFNHKNYD